MCYVFILVGLVMGGIEVIVEIYGKIFVCIVYNYIDNVNCGDIKLQRLIVVDYVGYEFMIFVLLFDVIND